MARNVYKYATIGLLCFIGATVGSLSTPISFAKVLMISDSDESIMPLDDIPDVWAIRIWDNGETEHKYAVNLSSCTFDINKTGAHGGQMRLDMSLDCDDREIRTLTTIRDNQRHEFVTDPDATFDFVHPTLEACHTSFSYQAEGQHDADSLWVFLTCGR